MTARDLEDNPLTFGLEPAAFIDGSGYFKIDPQSGDVTLVKSLLDQVRASFTIIISVADMRSSSPLNPSLLVLTPSGPSLIRFIAPGQLTAFNNRSHPLH